MAPHTGDHPGGMRGHGSTSTWTIPILIGATVSSVRDSGKGFLVAQIDVDLASVTESMFKDSLSDVQVGDHVWWFPMSDRGDPKLMVVSRTTKTMLVIRDRFGEEARFNRETGNARGGKHSPRHGWRSRLAPVNPTTVAVAEYRVATRRIEGERTQAQGRLLAAAKQLVNNGDTEVIAAAADYLMGLEGESE